MQLTAHYEQLFSTEDGPIHTGYYLQLDDNNMSHDYSVLYICCL